MASQHDNMFEDFNHALLQTSGFAENADPDCGDLFVPDDMREYLDRKNADGKLWGPTFADRSMVLIGPQRVGKTTLFNKITGMNVKAESNAKSVTNKALAAQAMGPAAQLRVWDTPGVAMSTSGPGMSVEEAWELRKALVKGIVSQIVVVVSATRVSRASAFLDSLQPVGCIFECDTFKCDGQGRDLSMLGPEHEHSPRRPRAFVVVTFRDTCHHNRPFFKEWVDRARAAVPWIGPVAFIDRGVRLSWIYDTIVACAGYDYDCRMNHTIPAVEMFTHWKIMVPEMKRQTWIFHVDQAESEIHRATSCAIEEIREAKAKREVDGKAGGSYEDATVAKMDCIIAFIHDRFDTITHETLAKCYEKKLEDLWATTDKHILNEMVSMMNAIKCRLAPKLEEAHKEIKDMYPTGVAAIYKKCPHCGTVYTRPTGCNVLGKCGMKAGVEKDDGHSGRLHVPYRYDYTEAAGMDRAHLQISKRGDRGLSSLEGMAYKIRRDLRSKIAEYNPADSDNGPPPSASSSTYDGQFIEGCGADLTWEELDILSSDELLKLGVLPTSNPAQEPTQDLRTMPLETFLKTVVTYIQDDVVTYPCMQYLDSMKTELGFVTVADMVRCGSREELHSSLISMANVRILHSSMICTTLERLVGWN